MDYSVKGDFLGEIPPEQRRLLELQERRRTERRAYRQTPAGRAERNRSKRLGRMNKRLEHPFVGVDGEGSEQAYLLLRAGDNYLHTGEPLSFEQCMDFLLEQSTDACYVAFFFDYDVTMMTRKLPGERLHRLLNPHLRTKGGHTFPLDYEGYQIDYRPGKEFKVRREGDKKWLTINDVGSFFQCSFVRALTAWGIGSSQELEQVKAGKDMRSDFQSMTKEVISYNQTECRLLAQLMSKFAASCRGIKYLPRKWQGPGELAAAMLAFHDAPRRDSLPNIPLDLWEAANKSYYGGRFETTAIGILTAPLYAWDINSAYPDSIRSLPCLEHGLWTLTRSPETGLFLSFGSYRPHLGILFGGTPPPFLYGLPFRTPECHIIFPGAGKGWYWSHEIAAAIHQEFTPEIVWNYHKNCDCKPFDWVPELYVKRKEWESQGKHTTAGNMGIALKLALNSLYGKMAQSIGQAPYANPIYASLITSLTRSKLYDAVHILSECDRGKSCGHSVYYLATDGLFTSTGPEGKALPSSGELGAWGVEKIDEDILLIQPGLYIGANQSRMKTRGIPKEKVEKYTQEFHRAWEKLSAREVQPNDAEAMVEIPFHQFLGVKQAVHFNRLSEAGTWQDLPRRYGFDWQSKREPNLTLVSGTHMRTLPPKGFARRETLGYGKHIGRWLEEHREWYESLVWTEAQPDEATFSASKSHIEW